MSRSFTLLAVSCFAVGALTASEVVKAPPESDMKPIFNGKDLTGWDGDPRLWSVKDGAIHGETTKEHAAKGNTFIIWKDGKTVDFELRLSFRCNATNNSGIQYRSEHLDKASNKWVVRGYQHEIRNQIKLPSVSGFIYSEKGKRGRMALVGDKTVWGKDGKQKKEVGALIAQEEFEKLFKLNEWNDVIIVAKGPHIQHFMNGRLIMDCVDEHPERARKEGILAFQLHAGKPMWTEFKNIRFKELK